MESGIRTGSSVRDRAGVGQRVSYWVLLTGSRTMVAAGIVLAFVGLVGGLIWGGLLAVGPDGFAATLFGSGLTSGVVTLVTIALSINQLILSRVFGSPSELRTRLEGTQELRHTVEELAAEPSTPTDPAAFLSVVATTLADRVSEAVSRIDESSWTAPQEVSTALGDVLEYGRNIDDHIEEGDAIVDVLDVVLGPEYAWNLTAVHHIGNEHGDDVPEVVRTEFEAIQDLLEAIAVARQFFKTLSLQQDFATLSRVLAYSGTVALFATISLTLVYRTTAVTLPPSLLPVVVVVGLGAIVAPVGAFAAYLLRAATIAHRTVSVGPFVPPNEQ